MGDKTRLERSMNEVFITYGTMITPLGNDSGENFKAMLEEKSGVQFVNSSGFKQENWPLGKINSLPDNNRYDELLKRTVQI